MRIDISLRILAFLVCFLACDGMQAIHEYQVIASGSFVKRFHREMTDAHVFTHVRYIRDGPERGEREREKERLVAEGSFDR